MAFLASSTLNPNPNPKPKQTNKLERLKSLYLVASVTLLSPGFRTRLTKINFSVKVLSMHSKVSSEFAMAKFEYFPLYLFICLTIITLRLYLFSWMDEFEKKITSAIFNPATDIYDIYIYKLDSPLGIKIEHKTFSPYLATVNSASSSCNCLCIRIWPHQNSHKLTKSTATDSQWCFKFHVESTSSKCF